MKLELFIERATTYEEQTVAVAVAEDDEVLEAVMLALKRNLARFLLIGDKEKITEMVDKKYPLIEESDKIKIIHANSREAAAEYAVKAVHGNKAQVLMKGNIPTSILLKEVLHKEYGLRTGSVLSHVAVFEVPGFNRFLMITDAGMNIAPTFEQKVHITQNAVQIAHGIGIECPLVAPLAAIEMVNPAMQATVDAALLTQMNRRGQLKSCIVDGPLALDIAVSAIAAEQKGINSEVAGKADILLVPSIEVGNTLYKSLTYFAHAKVASVIAGAKVPIVLTSRADSAESKLYSLALSICSVKK